MRGKRWRLAWGQMQGKTLTTGIGSNDVKRVNFRSLKLLSFFGGNLWIVFQFPKIKIKARSKSSLALHIPEEKISLSMEQIAY